MSRARVTITAAIPEGVYADGDYAMLYGDRGTGTLDLDTPLDASRYDLYRLGTPLTQLTAEHVETVCGDYQYAFVLFDSLGNRQAVDPLPAAATAHVHLAPATPSGLRATDYDPDTDTLTLEALS